MSPDDNGVRIEPASLPPSPPSRSLQRHPLLFLLLLILLSQPTFAPVFFIHLRPAHLCCLSLLVPPLFCFSSTSSDFIFIPSPVINW